MRNVILAMTHEEVEDTVANIAMPGSGIRVVCVATEPLKVCDVPVLDGVDAVILGERWATRFVEINQLATGTVCAPAKSLRLILLADEVTSAIVHQALAFGVADVVAHHQEATALLRDLRDSIDDTRLVCRDHVMRSVPVPDFLVRGDVTIRTLTDREIVGLIAAGYSDKEIAEVLHYSHQTICNRVSRLLLETGARNRTQLAVKFTTKWSAAHPVFG